MDNKHVIGLYEAYLDVYEGINYSPIKAHRGEDIGEPGKMFKEIERKAAKQYGSKKSGKRVAGAVLAKLRRAHEEVDLYDVVLEHLLDEGYCDGVESAEVIMANMSEEWFNYIVEAFNQKGEFIRDPNSTDSTPFPNPPQQWNPRGRRPAMTYVERRRLAATKTPEQIEQERQKRMRLGNQILNPNNQNNPTT